MGILGRMRQMLNHLIEGDIIVHLSRKLTYKATRWNLKGILQQKINFASNHNSIDSTDSLGLLGSDSSLVVNLCPLSRPPL